MSRCIACKVVDCLLVQCTQNVSATVSGGMARKKNLIFSALRLILVQSEGGAGPRLSVLSLHKFNTSSWLVKAGSQYNARVRCAAYVVTQRNVSMASSEIDAKKQHNATQ